MKKNNYCPGQWGWGNIKKERVGHEEWEARGNRVTETVRQSIQLRAEEAHGTEREREEEEKLRKEICIVKSNDQKSTLDRSFTNFSFLHLLRRFCSESNVEDLWWPSFFPGKRIRRRNWTSLWWVFVFVFVFWLSVKWIRLWNLDFGYWNFDCSFAGVDCSSLCEFR